MWIPDTPILIHGVTGSGKTELYLQAVAETLQQGRQAIILVPEISLTPQTVRRFVSRFPGQVGLIHSRLSRVKGTIPGGGHGMASSQLWSDRAARCSRPFANLGLIVVDECHDDSYYQGDFQPLYHAVETAIAYQKITGNALLLGSATPSVDMIYPLPAAKMDTDPLAQPHPRPPGSGQETTGFAASRTAWMLLKRLVKPRSVSLCLWFPLWICARN